MKERPILFQTPMVRAILAGTKTQTRRAVKGIALDWLAPGMFSPEFVANPENGLCPYGVPGDRLWVREAFASYGGTETHYHYRADTNVPNPNGGWKPSIHMPRAASRILLEVTAVRVERLQEISDEDAAAEGCPCYVCGRTMDGRSEDDCHCFHRHADAKDYRDLWDSINGDGSWEANPWVWVVEFRRLTP